MARVQVMFIRPEDCAAYTQTGWLPRDGAFVGKHALGSTGDPALLRASSLDILAGEEWSRSSCRKVPMRSFDILAVHTHEDRLFVIVRWS